ncbi:hypothetical protein [Flavobacterium sp. N1994]|uniref:hypothetical protein n=1 Tax=Flavobacterium sp. N1994 TaxID=2986827 RepID=UPI002222956E|nr:hypothetical protein [Flavobacterium sp. N1994]
MTPLHVFYIMFALQICGYILLDTFNLPRWKYLLLAIGLFLDFFILPDYFMPVYREGQLRCGLPELGIHLAFWIFGCGSIICTHIVYVILSSLNKAKKRT